MSFHHYLCFLCFVYEVVTRDYSVEVQRTLTGHHTLKYSVDRSHADIVYSVTAECK